MIAIADIRLRGDREPPLSRQELRALRMLAAAAPQIMAALAERSIGHGLCPTWRRIQEESARRASEG